MNIRKHILSLFVSVLFVTLVSCNVFKQYEGEWIPVWFQYYNEFY